MAKKKVEPQVTSEPTVSFSETVTAFKESRDNIARTVCDICGGTLVHHHRKNAQSIVGVGYDTNTQRSALGHKACWESLPEEEKQRRIDEWHSHAK